MSSVIGDSPYLSLEPPVPIVITQWQKPDSMWLTVPLRVFQAITRVKPVQGRGHAGHLD